jgi:hypothetical protein
LYDCCESRDSSEIPAILTDYGDSDGILKIPVIKDSNFIDGRDSKYSVEIPKTLMRF